jgi:hypothetical protein
LFLDYSSYGMPRKISSRMGMKGAGGITDGVEIAYTTYNYMTIKPEDPSDIPYGRNQGAVHLSDFPQFTQREEGVGTTDDNGNPTTATTTYVYSRTTDASTEVDTINYVGRNYKEATTIGTDSSSPLSFGKVISVEQTTSATPPVTLGKQVLTYVTGLDGEAEIGTVETFDEAGQSKKVQFDYGNYGRVIDKSEYGYMQASVYPLIRRTHYEYKDDQNYKDARFLRLVTSTSVFDASNALKAKTTIIYDNYEAMGGMKTYNLAPGQPPNHDATYDQNKTLRGNATAVTTFSQVAPDPEVSTTRHAKYDIFGNVVEVEVSCCVKKSFSFSEQTTYSEPDSVTCRQPITTTILPGSLRMRRTQTG